MLASVKNPSLGNVDSEELRRLILGWGATLAGFGDVRQGLADEFKHLPRAISIAVKHPSEKQGLLQKGKHYAYSNQFIDIDNTLTLVQKRIASWLQNKGWRAFAIPPDSHKVDTRFAAKLFPLFPHKTAATCAGLGWIGKSGLLINPDYGARLSWATVLTNAPLKTCCSPYLMSQCGECKCCVDACPSGAIKNIVWIRDKNYSGLIDAEACSEKLRENQKVFNQSVCGVCILSCPIKNKTEKC